jgi:hypothetical protein
MRSPSACSTHACENQPRCICTPRTLAIRQHKSVLGCADHRQKKHVCVCHAGEKYWRMPLDPDLKVKLESPIADLKNYAGMHRYICVCAYAHVAYTPHKSEWETPWVSCLNWTAACWDACQLL